MYCTGLAKNPLFGPTEIGFWVFGAKTRKTPWVFGAKEPRMRRNPSLQRHFIRFYDNL
jgi:hypothetical protein